MNKESRREVSSQASRAIKHLNESRDQSSTKAALAHLRNSIGRPLEEAPQVWPLLFQYMEAEDLSNYPEANYQELAVYTTLQIYAIHQQGRPESVLREDYLNMGGSLRTLRGASLEESKAIDRRFNTLVTATSFEEFVHHLRQMVKLLKREKDGKVNYYILCQDLLSFLYGQEDKVKMTWSRDYYRASKKEGEENERN